MKPLVPHGSGISEQINITRNGKSIMDIICLLDSTPCLLRLTVKIAFSPEIFFFLNSPKLRLLHRVFDHQNSKPITEVPQRPRKLSHPNLQPTEDLSLRCPSDSQRPYTNNNYQITKTLISILLGY